MPKVNFAEEESGPGRLPPGTYLLRFQQGVEREYGTGTKGADLTYIIEEAPAGAEDRLEEPFVHRVFYTPRWFGQLREMLAVLTGETIGLEPIEWEWEELVGKRAIAEIHDRPGKDRLGNPRIESRVQRWARYQPLPAPAPAAAAPTAGRKVGVKENTY